MYSQFLVKLQNNKDNWSEDIKWIQQDRHPKLALYCHCTGVPYKMESRREHQKVNVLTGGRSRKTHCVVECMGSYYCSRWFVFAGFKTAKNNNHNLVPWTGM